MHIDRRMLALTAGVRWRIVLTCIAGLASIGAMVAQGLLTARILTRVFDGDDLTSVVPHLLGVVALIGALALLLWLREVAGMWTAAGMKVALRRRLYARLLALGPGYLERTETGKAQSTLVDGVEALEGYMGRYIPQLVVCFVAPAAILVVIAALDPFVGAICLAAMLLALLGGKAYEKALGTYATEHWDAYRNLNAVFLDSMQGMTTLKAFNASKRRGAELEETSRVLFEATRRQISVSVAGTGIIAFAMALGAAMSVGVGAVRVSQGALGMSELFILLFLASLCFAPLVDLNAYWHQGFLGISAATGIFALLETTPDVQDPAGEAQAAPSRQPGITFSNVSFAYDSGARPALRSLTFSAAPGETVAIVGRSGAGKSTVVSLLLRFFDPFDGAVLIDGIDVREMPLAQLRALISVVSQETYLFHGTVADNLRLARPGASQAEVELATRAANAHDFVSELPQGYGTLVGERGLLLSGGQRQRLAIARALLKDAPILILDEATSSVDAENEAAIQDALERLTRDRTTLIIAHRLSTIANADRIIVLHEGRAIETGEHADLIAREGAYARLIAAQRGAVVS